MPGTELDHGTWTKLALITGRARREPNCQFTSLAHLLDEEFLADCYHRLGRDRASGVDGVTWKEYGEHLDENLRDLVARMKDKRYKPLPAKRVYIPEERALPEATRPARPGRQDRPGRDRQDSGGDLRGGLPGLFVRFSTGAGLPPGAQCGGQDDHDAAGQPPDRRRHQRLL